MIYAVTRRYTVEEIIYVEASSPTDARREVEHGEWIDNTAAQTVSESTYRKAMPRPDMRVEFGELVNADGETVVR